MKSAEILNIITSITKTKLDPQAFRNASGLVACWVSANMWVGKVDTGSKNELGIFTPENAVAINIIGAVSPIARAIPINNPVMAPLKPCGKSTFAITCHLLRPNAEELSLYTVGMLFID